MFGSVKPGGDADRRAYQQRYQGQLERSGIVRQDDAGDRLLEAERFAKIAADDTCEIMPVLRGDRLVEAERVAHLLQILGARALAKHLLHGIAGNDVHQQKYQSNDEPQPGKSKEQAQRNVTDHFRRRSSADAGAKPFSVAAPASAGCVDSCATAAGSGLILTRETRRRSISVTVKR